MVTCHLNYCFQNRIFHLSTSASAQPNDISKLQWWTLPLGQFKFVLCSRPSSRFACLSQVTSFQKLLHMTCPVQSYAITYEWMEPECQYCGEANPMLLPVCTLNFVLGNTSMLFWKIYLDESLWCIVSVAHCSFPFLLICCCFLSFCVAMLEELGQNGNYILLQIVGCSIIKYFAEFVGFVISPHVPCCCIPFL